MSTRIMLSRAPTGRISERLRQRVVTWAPRNSGPRRMTAQGQPRRFSETRDMSALPLIAAERSTAIASRGVASSEGGRRDAPKCGELSGRPTPIDIENRVIIGLQIGVSHRCAHPTRQGWAPGFTAEKHVVLAAFTAWPRSGGKAPLSARHLLYVG